MSYCYNCRQEPCACKEIRAAKKKKKRRFVAIIIAAVVAVLAIFLAVMSIRFIDETQVAAVRRFGVVQEETLGAGVHWRTWPIHRVDRYSVVAQEMVFEGIDGMSGDAQNIFGNITVIYYIDPGSVADIARQFGSPRALISMLDGVLLNEIQNVFASKTAMEIAEARAYIGVLATEGMRGIGDYFHINIRQTNVERIYFSPEFERAIEQRVIAEQEMMRADFERDRAVVLADQERQVAYIEAEANRLRARGEADALSIILDEWEAASPLVIDARLRQQFIYRWNGILPEVFAGDDLGLIIGGQTLPTQ